MKLLSHIDLPDLRAKLVELDRNIEFIALNSAEPVPANIDGDMLLTFSAGNHSLESILKTATSLRWIHVFGTGIDNFPLQSIGARTLTIGRGLTAVPMAEWVMAMLLAAAKNLPASWIRTHETPWNFANLQSLAGQTLAIAGYGTIGRALAVRAKAFDMRIRALTANTRAGNDGIVEFAHDWNDLVRNADHIVLALPLTSATHHLVNAAALAACKNGAHLVNVARGAIIDQDALHAALDSGHIALASLDTVTPEPLPAGHWLYTHPRVRLSPHISWSAPNILSTMQRFYLDNVARFLRGETLHGVVNVNAGY